MASLAYPEEMEDELQKTREFAELIERRTGVRLDDAEAHALHERLLALYQLLIRQPPQQSPSSEDAQASQIEHEAL